MSHTESTKLNLSKLTEEQRLKITQGILDDLLRALNLGNYSLIWRYFSDDFNTNFSADDFSDLHQALIHQYQQLESAQQISSTLAASDFEKLDEEWQILTKTAQKLYLKLTLIPVKEFLVIDTLSIKAID